MVSTAVESLEFNWSPCKFSASLSLVLDWVLPSFILIVTIFTYLHVVWIVDTLYWHTI